MPSRLDLLALSAQRHTLLAARTLDRYRKDPACLGLLPASLKGALFSSRAVDNVFRVRWLQAVVALLLVPSFVLHISSLANEHHQGRIPRFMHYRFTSLERRDGGELSGPGIAEFGMMRIGERGERGEAASHQGVRKPCRAADAKGTLRVVGDSMVLSLPDPREDGYDLWYIEAQRGEGTEGNDAVRFKLEGSDDPELEGWQVVGSSSAEHFYGHVTFTHSPAATPTGRGEALLLDASLPWGQVFLSWLTMLFYLFALLTLALSVAGRSVEWSIVLNICIQSAVNVVYGLSELDWALRDGGARHRADAAQALMVGTAFGLAGLWLWRYHEFFEFSFVLVGVVRVAAMAHVHRVLFAAPLTLAAASRSPLWTSLGFVVIGAITFAIRLRAIRQAIRAMEVGKAKFEGQWRLVLASQLGEVLRLEETVASIQRGVRHRTARQLIRVTELPRDDEHSRLSVVGSLLSCAKRWRRDRTHPSPSEQEERGGAQRRVGRTGAYIQGSRMASLEAGRIQPNVRNWVSCRNAWEEGSVTSDDAGKGAWGFLADNILQSQRLYESMLRYSAQAGNAAESSPSTLVETLDQLHAQAFLVSGMFVELVVRLGRLYQGKFRLKTEGGGRGVDFATWHGGPVSGSRFALGGIKSVSSCVAKLDASYGRDVSLLLDMCRETLYFDSVTSLEACLRAIGQDETLEVVRVKSTMQASCGDTQEQGPSFLFGGMRFVSVGLRLVGSEQARSLCVDTHVCELLLVLTDVARVETSEMHDAYKEWRKVKRVAAAMWRMVSWASRVPDRQVAASRPVALAAINTWSGETDTPAFRGSQSGEDSSVGKHSSWGSSEARGGFGAPSAAEGPSCEEMHPAGSETSSEVDSAASAGRNEQPCPILQPRIRPITGSPPPMSRLGDTSQCSHGSGGVRLGDTEHLVLSSASSGGFLQPRGNSPALGPWSSADPHHQHPLHPRESRPTVEAWEVSSLEESRSRVEAGMSPLGFSDPPWLQRQPPLSGGMSPLELSRSISRAEKLLTTVGVGDSRVERVSPLAPTIRPREYAALQGASPLPVGGSRNSSTSGSVNLPSAISSSFKMQAQMEPVEEQVGGDMEKVVAWLNGLADVNRDYKWDGGETSWGLSVSGELVELLEGLCRMSALGISDFLDRRFEAVRSNKDHSYDSLSLGAIVYSTKPISSALFTRPFQLFILAIAAFFVQGGIRGAIQYHRMYAKGHAYGPFEHYRFETLLTRNGTMGAAVAGPGVSQFGVIGSSGCTPDGSLGSANVVKPAFSAALGTSLVATYPSGATMIGWYLYTAEEEGSQALDPAYFTVWATNDKPEVGDGKCALGRGADTWWDGVGADETRWCGANWTRVGAPHWRFIFGDSSWDFLQVPTTLSVKRGAAGLESFLLLPPWHHFHLYWIFPTLIAGCGMISAVFVALLAQNVVPRRFHVWLVSPRLLLTGGIAMGAVSCVVHAAWTFLDGMRALPIETFVTGLTLTLMGACTFFEGHNGPTELVLFWTYALSENISWAIVCNYFWHTPAERESPAGLMGLFLICMFTTLRLKAVWSSNKLLRQDQMRYDAMWERMWGSDDSRAHLVELDRVVCSQALPTDSVTRQYNRLRLGTPTSSPNPSEARLESQQDNGSAPVHPLFVDLGLQTVPLAKDRASHIASCNQLYCQGAISSLLLMERIREWSAAANGMLPVAFQGSSEYRYARWNDIRHDEAARRTVRWTKMKRHDRCIQKLLRSYNNDPSFLLDISRGTIAFDSLADLTLCLETIIADDCVVLERIKNRMSPTYPSHQTAGYRDVCINLRIVSPQAQAFGAELHVCELQLVHIDFAKLKTSEGHHRYVRARNARGS